MHLAGSGQSPGGCIGSIESLGGLLLTKAALILVEPHTTDGNILVKETTSTLASRCKHKHCVVVGGSEGLRFLLPRSCSMSG